MRRFDGARNDTGGGRGFRVIEAGGRYLEPLTPPPPPRAPEPYKVASTVLGRAHRRSSFVIIAETRPATPSSTESPSPTLPPTGRISPFRGRGFKGPLPRAQPRTRNPDGQRYPYERRASVSQQSSPRRSLIPQPTRRRSSSLTRNNGTRSSPKFGRRAVQVPRNNANVRANSNNRKNSFRVPDLSPIQGTPTKPETVGRQRTSNSRGDVTPLKKRSNLAVPTYGSGRATSQVKSPGKIGARPETRRFVETTVKIDDDARTKIPVRRGSLVGKTAVNSQSNRFVVSNPSKPIARAVKPNNVIAHETTTNDGVLPGNGSDPPSNENSVRQLSSRLDADSSDDTKNHRDNEVGLMDLLKQSSRAMGTSSMVNTTTTTAVQPLQIDGAILLEDRENADKRRTPSMASTEPSPITPATTANIGNEATNPKSSKTTARSDATSDAKKVDDRDVPTSTATTQLANGSHKNPSRTSNPEDTATAKTSQSKEHINPASVGQNAREKQPILAAGNSRKNLHANKNAAQDNVRLESRVPSANPAGPTAESNSTDLPKNSVKHQTGSEIKETSGMEVSERLAAANGPGLGGAAPHKKSNRTGEPGKILGGQTDVAKDPKQNENRNESDATRKSHRANGSENSLKSFNGLSTISVESARSTDTGVSLDTVRGVSSAREKKGTHTMKRTEEIETLSGNVMHLERNGEPPSVLDIVEGAEVISQDQTRLDRIKKSLNRFRDRLPNMRCLGCRRGQKARTWIEERRNRGPETRNNEATNEATNVAGNSRCDRLWTSWKNACRCTQLRECKCCRRATRIAPAETTSCCPREGKCRALCCGRLFSCCKRCDKSEAQHTRSIRAKHSLTSVAPPPLSEEQGAKIPEVLVEHNSVMRGAIPCLPVPIAWFCLVWNVLLPGSGTIWSGLFNLCVGQPRFSISAGSRARFGALIVNIIVGVSQFFTVLFCLVGWGWSIWWGVTMIRLARKYKRFRASEAASNDLEARAGEQTGLPAGVPSQALRGMERAR